MFYFEAIVILLLIYGVYIYAPYMLNNKQWRQHDIHRTIYTNENADAYPYGDADNYALSAAMVADDFYLPDVREPRRRKHYPQPLPRPVYRYIPPNFYANQSSMLYYSGLPTGKALSDWSNLM
jgi:hypothetical protein